MSETRNTTTLTLERAEALVLFEMLAESEGENCLPLRTPAEKLAVTRLQGALERVLVEPFLPEYHSIVDEARTDLLAQARAA